MKIRINGNSLRYRLSKSDVETFARNGYLEQAIDFGNIMLIYALQQNNLNNLSVIFENNRIILFMPKVFTNEWSITDRVGFEYQYNNLFLLVEKDFKCLDSVAEDQSDNYPNPLSKPQSH